MNPAEWNPRYLNYARAHGRTPDEQLAFDEIIWKGGRCTGFLLWNRERIGEARRAIPAAFLHGGVTDHAAYDSWLTDWTDARVAACQPLALAA